MNIESPSDLKSIPLFKELNPEHLQTIADELQEKSFKDGEIVFEAGDTGDCLYIIKEGGVRIYIKAGETGEEITLSELNAGDYFGEMALLTGEPRSASVQASGDVTLLQLDKDGFENIISKNPKMTLSISHMLSQRLKDANVKRVEAESHAGMQFNTTGQLSEFAVIEILKFCEQNSLSGYLHLKSKDQRAEVHFEKGQLQTIDCGGREESEALDEILSWTSGSFVIEPVAPRLEHVSEEEEKSDAADEAIKEKPADKGNPISEYLKSFLRRMVSVYGSKNLAMELDKARNELQPYFPVLDSVKLEVSGGVRVSVPQEPVNDKLVLATAVLAGNIAEACRKNCIGFDLLNPKEIEPGLSDTLTEVHFFEYMEQSKELI